MIFQTTLYLSLIIFALGLIFKISTWFRYDFERPTKRFTTRERFLAAMGGVTATFFSGRLLTLLKTLLLDVFCQQRIMRESRLRWLMHMCLFWGFLLLLLMHALEE